MLTICEAAFLRFDSSATWKHKHLFNEMKNDEQILVFQMKRTKTKVEHKKCGRKIKQIEQMETRMSLAQNGQYDFVCR